MPVNARFGSRVRVTLRGVCRRTATTLARASRQRPGRVDQLGVPVDAVGSGQQVTSGRDLSHAGVSKFE